MLNRHSPVVALLCCLFVCLLTSCASTPRMAERFPDHISVSVADGVQTEVELAWPPDEVPRALVVVLPGTDGYSDIYFGAELAKARYDPNRRGGLTEAITRAGYVVAFVGQRGFRRLKDCASGSDIRERVTFFAEHCVDKRVRSQVRLATTTEDYRKVFIALSEHPSTKGFTHIVLPVSEGMYHVSTLIGRKEIAPHAVVAIGGAFPSIADVMEYQMTREYFFRLAEKALEKCSAEWLKTPQALACLGIPEDSQTGVAFKDIFSIEHGSHNIAMQGNTPDPAKKTVGLFSVVSRNLIPEMRRLNKEYFRMIKEGFRARSDEDTLFGNFRGIQIPSMWSGRFFADYFDASFPCLDMMRGYSGSIVLLYGRDDSLIPLPDQGPCDSKAKVPLAKCEVAVVDGVGHGLEDETGFPTQKSLTAIVQALNSVQSASSRIPY